MKETLLHPHSEDQATNVVPAGMRVRGWELAEGWGEWSRPRAHSAPEQMLRVAEAALRSNNGLNFGRTGLCTWEGLRSPELGFLLLSHAFAFLLGSAELPLPKITGGTVQAMA